MEEKMSQQMCRVIFFSLKFYLFMYLLVDQFIQTGFLCTPGCPGTYSVD